MQINGKVALAIAIVPLLIAAYFWPRGEALELADTRFDGPTAELEAAERGRLIAPGVSARLSDVRLLPGLVLVVNAAQDGDEAPLVSIRDSIPQFRPAPSQLDIDNEQRVLFRGRIERSAGFNAGYLSQTSGLDVTEAAEVVVTDRLLVTFKDPTTIPTESLLELSFHDGKDYYFVEAAALTTTDIEVFQEVDSSSNLSGSVFKAGGKLYASTDRYQSTATVSLRVFNVRYLQETEGSLADSVRPWTLELEPSDVRDLLDEWSASSKSELERRIESIDIRPPLSQSPVWYGDFLVHHPMTPIPQSRQNDCWAAALTMLFNWKTEMEASIDQMIEVIGDPYQETYEKDHGLTQRAKEFLPDAVGLTWRPGQSYRVEGVIDLLRTYGPLWFTTKQDFGVHARVVYGLSGSGAWDETFVHSIDPSSGETMIEPYRDFMLSYEQIGYTRGFNMVVMHWPD